MRHPTPTRVDEAMLAAQRAAFLPDDVRHLSADDRPLPIGSGATNSQPSTVRAMLTLLDVQPGAAVLDVGTGSGWTTAILAHLVGASGRVTGVELEPALVEMGRRNLGVQPNAVIHQAHPGQLGWPQDAPYDRILVSAMADRIPDQLFAQLASGGTMVIPVDSRMLVVRAGANGIDITEHGRYRFVPLRG